MLCLAHNDLETRHLERAAQEIGQGVAITREVGDRYTEAYLAAVGGARLALSGHTAEARSAFRSARALVGEVSIPELAAIVEVLEGCVATSVASAELSAGRPARAAAQLATATECRVPRSARAEDFVDIRRAVRLLDGAIEEVGARCGDARPEAGDAHLVGPGAEWFALCGGERVDLGRRPTLARVLHALVLARLLDPGVALTTQVLFQRAWPSDRAARESAANRVWVALAGLRKLGWKPFLLKTNVGYLLDPAAPICFATSTPDRD
jgi:hypothetical protein